MTEETILGNIIGVASEGQGIIRYNGFVIFIPYTVTGDIVRFRIVEEKKNFAIGELVEIVEASPLRIKPVCSYYGNCGGCQLQHVRYEEGLSFKRQWIEDSLQRIGGFKTIQVPHVISAKQQWHYRRRISLTLRPFEKTFQSGYIATNKASLVVVTHCPIFVEKEDKIVSIVQEISGTLLSDGVDEGKVSIHKNNEGTYTLYFHFRQMPKNMEEVLEKALTQYPSICGLLADSMKKTLRLGVFKTELEIGDASLKIEFTPKAFVQNHPEQSLAIYNVIEAVAKRKQPKKALDLYCGIGISSLLLAKQNIDVIGVEANKQAIVLANSNAKNNEITQAQFIVADVASVLKKILNRVNLLPSPLFSNSKKENVDFVIVNPPREGMAKDVVQILCENPVKTLIYISCNPGSLARDLKKLCEHSYSIETVEGFDMFPQTAHVETIVVLQGAI